MLSMLSSQADCCSVPTLKLEANAGSFTATPGLAAELAVGRGLADRSLTRAVTSSHNLVMEVSAGRLQPALGPCSLLPAEPTEDTAGLLAKGENGAKPSGDPSPVGTVPSPLGITVGTSTAVCKSSPGCPAVMSAEPSGDVAAAGLSSKYEIREFSGAEPPGAVPLTTALPSDPTGDSEILSKRDLEQPSPQITLAFAVPTRPSLSFGVYRFSLLAMMGLGSWDRGVARGPVRGPGP